VVHHSAVLTEQAGDPALARPAEAVASANFQDLPARLEAMCEYAVALTLRPHHAEEDLLNGMRRAGLSAREIIDVNQVVSYLNYVNRVAQGLGVRLEPDWQAHLHDTREYDLGH